MKCLRNSLIIVLLICHAASKRDFTIEVMYLDLKVVNWNVVKSVNTNIEELKVMSLEFALHQNVTELSIKLNYDLLTKNNRRVSLLKMNFNGCESLKAVYKNNFLKIMMNEVLRKSNFPNNCPLMANTLYYIRNYTVNDEDYPNFFPVVSFHLTMDFIANQKHVMTSTLKGRVRRL